VLQYKLGDILKSNWRQHWQELESKSWLTLNIWG
jgi:hypothetical protein